MSIRIAATAVIAMAIPICLSAQEQEEEATKPPSYSVLYAFSGGADGSDPSGPLVRDRAGNLYGVTEYGGYFTSAAFSQCVFGCGVVFKLDRAGKETVLYRFKGGTDGSRPEGPLILDEEGNLYGTTSYGGDLSASGACPGYGCGVVFKLDRAGKETVLHSFIGTDGELPGTGVIRDEEGNLYGATHNGGDIASASPSCFGDGCGVVFKLDRAGNETVLHSFTGGTDGAGPDGSLVRDKDGNLYGATNFGGSNGWGTVFKVEPFGTETVLHSFALDANGAVPLGVIRDEDGNLYGATSNGGDLTGLCGGFGCGVVFKLDRAGNETVLYSFPGGAPGDDPQSPLIRDHRGNLYGATWFGGDLTSSSCMYGASGCGVVFKVEQAGNETVLYSFTGGADGLYPSGVIRDKEGNLYGTTFNGGDLTSSSCAYGKQGCGVVFKIQLHEEYKRDANGDPEPDADVDPDNK